MIVFVLRKRTADLGQSLPRDSLKLSPVLQLFLIRCSFQDTFDITVRNSISLEQYSRKYSNIETQKYRKIEK